MVELGYTSGLSPAAERIAGSIPAAGSICASDVIGKRVGLKTRCLLACEFKSHLAHHIPHWCKGSIPGFEPGGRGSLPWCGAI